MYDYFGVLSVHILFSYYASRVYRRKKMSIWGDAICEFSFLCLCDFGGWLKAKCRFFI